MNPEIEDFDNALIKASASIPQTGPAAIKYALDNLDLDEIEQQALEDLKTGKRTKRSGAVARLRIVKGMRRNNQTPSDYYIKYIPVLPAKFRPFAAAGGTFIAGDANVLYKDFFDIKNAHDEERELFGEENAGQSLLDLYDAARSVYGYGEPVKAKTKAKDVKGFMQKIVGSTAKFSYAQRRLFSKTQDNTGRSTVVVDPDYGIDDIGIPEDMAFTMYAPYIQRRLKLGGMKDIDALKAVRDRTPAALAALQKEVEVRPVLYSRAPSWHKFNVLAGKPKLVKGDAIAVNPYITTGMNMDFDGDQQLNIIELRISEELYNSGILCHTLKNCLYKIPSDTYNNDVYKNTTKLHTTVNEEYQGSIHIEDFPHGEFSNSVEGKNGRIDFYHVPNGVKVLAYDARTGELSWQPVAYWSKHYSRYIEIVHLENNLEIITDDDPRAVYGLARDSAELELERFNPTEAEARGVLVPVMRDASGTTPVDLFAVTIPGIGEVELTRDFGEFLGMLAGDGWWDKRRYDAAGGVLANRKVYFADNEGFNASFITAQLEALSKGDLHTYSQEELKDSDSFRYGNSVKYTYAAASLDLLPAWLTETLGGERDDHTAGAANKHLPSFFLRTPKEFRIGLFCGLIATDGAVSVSNAKGKPQLMVSFTSTAFRLCQEIKLLGQSLGCTSTITYAKTTQSGNDAWIVNFHTPALKKAHVLERMRHTRKRDTFVNTPVELTEQAHKNDRIPIPEIVSTILRPFMYNPKVSKAALEGLPAHVVAEKKRAASLYSNFNQSCNKGTITRATAKAILEWMREEKAKAEANVQLVLEWLQSDSEEFGASMSSAIRDAINTVAPAGSCIRAEGVKVQARINAPLRAGKMSKKVKASIYEWLEAHKEVPSCLGHPIIEKWKSHYILNEGIQWVAIESVEKTGKREDGYDLTVPGFETFTAADGVVLSNTINVHVPSSDKAVKEAYERMLPSAEPFSDRQPDKIVPLPKQEQILGLYTAATAQPTAPVVFNTQEEALHAIRTGKVKLSQDVEILGN